MILNYLAKPYLLLDSEMSTLSAAISLVYETQIKNRPYGRQFLNKKLRDHQEPIIIIDTANFWFKLFMYL
ncbi:MAG: hypothetical protein A2538_01700 [Candidatus Magasanikbacteria bacterium RIFOXYD2_FULL_41_14]|uniref:Uncharacterized protein n=1 Tax=Candidatus Magasanikbacteria bacterium RIFOXYD2_FULL_41_14 TaxID=1798709 RepID=A0A1F6PDL6_9BACT|nr:MAG: hypothetical protein A2538_01700 [Candidatus Magasanikbacteria bacterium RIFOXYD2_FULL_41_14]